jgi:hypothetical protein
MMDDGNARALTPLRKSSIAVLSARLAVKTIAEHKFKRTCLRQTERPERPKETVVYRFRSEGRSPMSHATSTRQPSYRKHKATGQAVVALNGKDVYLGRFKSKSYS